MKVKEYIDSGILESYVLGSVSEEETRELLRLKKQYPEIQQALHELEVDMERIAAHMAIAPPPGMWTKIEGSINELINTPEIETLRLKDFRQYEQHKYPKDNQYIDIESETMHMRVHKNWKWILRRCLCWGRYFWLAPFIFTLKTARRNSKLLN